MNILILAVGTRNKIVQYFKQTWKDTGLVAAADASGLAPALYDADKYFIVPPITSADYKELILRICKEEKINGILSLIDPELGLLASMEEEFRAAGTMVIGSSPELCDISLDKMKMYRWLSAHGYDCARSWTDLDAFLQAVSKGEAGYPVFVKPVTGSASIHISKAEDEEILRQLFARQEGLMVQEYLDGPEIGADVYVDMITGEVVSIFTKKKIRMRAGETDKSVSFKDDRLFELIERFVREAGFRGPIDIDLFDIGGRFYISEVNPRFGGGYLHAYECGCNHMQLILNNLRGIPNKKQIGCYEEGVYMMKYNEVCIRKDIEE